MIRIDQSKIVQFFFDNAEELFRKKPERKEIHNTKQTSRPTSTVFKNGQKKVSFQGYFAHKNE